MSALLIRAPKISCNNDWFTSLISMRSQHPWLINGKIMGMSYEIVVGPKSSNAFIDFFLNKQNKGINKINK